MSIHLKKCFIALMLCCGSALMAISQPYASVRALPSSNNSIFDGYAIGFLINNNNYATIIDVGSAGGEVARTIAQQNFPTISSLYNVSSWTSLDPSQKHLYQQFLSNVISEGSTEKITSIRMNSLEAADALNIIADLIYLGNTDGTTLHNEIVAWFSHLSANGTIFGTNWSDHAIQTAVTIAASDLNLVLRIVDNSWYLERS